MQPYIERATNVGLESQIAVYVLLSRDNSDIEFVPLRPHVAPPEAITTKEEFIHRQLRSVGVVGLNGVTPLCAFKEPLEPCVVNCIAAAFMEYTRVLIAGNLQAQMEDEIERRKGDSVAWCERLFLLEDSRSHPYAN
jgi:hypothetical protein